MSVFSRAVPALVVCTLVWVSAPSAEAGKYAQQLAERDAVQKGVDFVTQGSVYWIRDRGCFTCHAIGMGALASGVNASNGYAVNQHEYDTMARFVMTLQRPDGSLLGGKREVSLTALMGTGFALGSRSAAKGYAEPIGKMGRFLLAARAKEGGWGPDYQRDVVISGEVMTSALAALVLRESAHVVPEGAKFAEAAAAWRRSLKTAAFANTTDVVFALLGKAAGADEADRSAIEELKKELFALQNADGGWPLKKGDKTGIIITSQALFALAASGAGREEPHVKAAVAYMFQRQREDGTWVPDGQGKEFNRFVPTFTRTAWATIAMSSILEVNSLIAKRSEVLAELKDELGTGLADPNKLHRLARAQLLLRDGTGACQSFEKLVALAPQQASYRHDLARAYLAVGDKAKAAAAYRKYLETDVPAATRLAVVQTMAECLEETGEKKAAATAYVQMVDPQLSPRVASARRLLPKITALDPGAKIAAHYRIATEWEVTGPFPCEGDDGLAKAYPPEKGADAAWQRFTSKDPLGVLDLTEPLKKAENVCGYVRLQLSSPLEKQAQLRIGSEGSIAAWLNGKEVLRKQAARELVFDQDRADITIPKGNSTLLVKVCQSKGRWGLVLRLSDKDGKPLDDVTLGTPATSGAAR